MTTTDMIELPIEVKLRMYQYAGLLNDTMINLNPGIYWPQEPEIATLQNYRNLIRVCRRNSQNTFTIRVLSSTDFALLQYLRPSTVRSLTNLTIHLNTTTCLPPSRCRQVLQPIDERMPPPLSLRDSSRTAIITTWRVALSDLLCYVPTGQLRLQLIGDCEDLEAAKQVVAPLLHNDTELRSCAVRLARWPDPDISRLSEYAALSAMHKSTSITFPFLSLPREIRLYILEYTDLVTPRRELQWTSQGGFDTGYDFVRCSIGEWDYSYEECPPSPHHACRYCNLFRTDTIGCFCRRYHAAWSAKCRCWASPTALFLVSRAVLEDARTVFYTCNRVILFTSECCRKAAKATPPRIDPDIFLRDVVKIIVLRHLRFLDVVFPPFDHDYLRRDEPAYEGWLQTIEHIKHHASLSVLTLRVRMADHPPNGSGVSQFRVNITPEQAQIVIDAYKRILMPLQRLEGLRKLFLHLAWPFRWRREIASN